jgi:hypothetical protein
MVVSTLKGAMRRQGKEVKRKDAISTSQLNDILTALQNDSSYDTLLFLAILLVGFFALLRLGEMTIPDNPKLREPKKEILRTSVFKTSSTCGFLLPGNKTDRFFKGNKIIIRANSGSPNPLPFLLAYIAARDQKFPYHSGLFVTSRGTPPTSSWFTNRLREFLPENYSGHSLRAGGATWLASIGASPSLIQGMGRWTSDTWQQYIRKHPIVIHALLSSSRNNA